MQKEVTDFLGGVMSKRLSWDVAERARRLLRLTDELESVSDEAAAVLKAMKRLRAQNQRISDVSLQVILSVHDRVAAFVVIRAIIRPFCIVNSVNTVFGYNEAELRDDMIVYAENAKELRSVLADQSRQRYTEAPSTAQSIPESAAEGNAAKANPVVIRAIIRPFCIKNGTVRPCTATARGILILV